MKRYDGTQGIAPFTFTFHKTDCYATDPAHIQADTIGDALKEVPWPQAQYIQAMDAEGHYVF